jgi:hypothetical protein
MAPGTLAETNNVAHTVLVRRPSRGALLDETLLQHRAQAPELGYKLQNAPNEGRVQHSQRKI